MLKNINQYILWIFYGVLFSGIAIFQASFISSLPPFFTAIDLNLLLLIFILVFFNLKLSLITALLLGFWADLFGFYFFGLNSLTLIASVVVVDLILNNWLTNRSLYSFLALSVIAIIIRNFTLGLLLLFSEQAAVGWFIINENFWLLIFRQIIWALIFILLFFNLANSVSHKLKPFFLENK